MLTLVEGTSVTGYMKRTAFMQYGAGMRVIEFEEHSCSSHWS